MAALMTLLLGSQQLHMLLVEHEVCEYHGHLSHGNDGHDESHEASTANERDEQAAVSSTDDGAHDHCDALATESAHPTLQSWQQVDQIPARAQQLFVTLSLSVDRRQLLLRAPKTSPPIC